MRKFAGFLYKIRSCTITNSLTTRILIHTKDIIVRYNSLIKTVGKFMIWEKIMIYILEERRGPDVKEKYNEYYKEVVILRLLVMKTNIKKVCDDLEHSSKMNKAKYPNNIAEIAALIQYYKSNLK